MHSTLLRQSLVSSRAAIRRAASGRFYSSRAAYASKATSRPLVWGTVATVAAAVAASYTFVNPIAAESSSDEEKLKEVASKPVETEPKAEPTKEPKGESAGESTDSAEDHQEGAYNPETGEINWDCPCLGGMANGPCGEEFKAAFSCFVYSKEEPKGIECIEKFKNMQECFKKYPEVYAEELREDEEYAEVPSASPETPESTEVAEVVAVEVDTEKHQITETIDKVFEDGTETVEQVVIDVVETDDAVNSDETKKD